jgi:hypothetical protein
MPTNYPTAFCLSTENVSTKKSKYKIKITSKRVYLNEGFKGFRGPGFE